MKKICILCFVIFGFYFFSNNNIYINDDESIRFRVIANSNSIKDIMIKELVVNELSSLLFNNDNIKDTRNKINNNMDIIKNKIKNIFNENDYNKEFSILFGMNEFPRKEYNGIVYEEGLYESLVIEIGEAQGDNYWCFLYPSLCMIDVKKDVKYKSKIIEFFNNILM